jgi:hypothetical protein
MRWAAALLAAACGALPPVVDAGVTIDAGDPWGDRVVSFTPGPGAGFGQDQFPAIVLGPPHGAGASQGSLDVLSLGKQGEIIVEFTDVIAVDGEGPDVLVFENPFSGFVETGEVSVSDDGVDWRTFPCAATLDGGTAGCAGVNPVFSNPTNGLSGTDPMVAGGDAFDLADVGLARARFVRVRDTGTNRFYAPPAGGFDLDAVAVVHGGEP